LLLQPQPHEITAATARGHCGQPVLPALLILVVPKPNAAEESCSRERACRLNTSCMWQFDCQADRADAWDGLEKMAPLVRRGIADSSAAFGVGI